MKMEKEILDQINEYLFLALDKRENRVIVATNEVENGYRGFVLGYDNTGYNLSPLYIAATFIQSNEDNYDFTNDLDEAINFLTTTHTSKTK